MFIYINGCVYTWEQGPNSIYKFGHSGEPESLTF